jgi:hypothetical protein
MHLNVIWPSALVTELSNWFLLSTSVMGNFLVHEEEWSFSNKRSWSAANQELPKKFHEDIFVPVTAESSNINH